MFYPKNFLDELVRDHYQVKLIKITKMTWDEIPIEDIQGNATQGSLNIDGNSAIRTTGSLTLLVKNVNLSNYNIALGSKIKIEIGIENHINNKYPKIIWISQGIFVVTSFNTSINTTGATINLSFKDKMCLLNGEIGGVIGATTDFAQVDDYNYNYEFISDQNFTYRIGEYYYWYENKDNPENSKFVLDMNVEKTDGRQYYRRTNNKIISSLKVKDIIQNAVHIFGGESLNRIIINDLDLYGLELLEYRGDKPLYLVKWDNTNKVKDLTCFENCLPEDLPDEKKIVLEYGDLMGYHGTELVYPGSLVANAGESVVSVLDKIKNMLSNFEYFYNTDGYFVFQAKHDYQEVNHSAISTIENGEVLIDTSVYNTAISHVFNDAETFTQISHTPNLTNIYNDYSIWGQRVGMSGAKIPIHLRYAFQEKPNIYTPIHQNRENPITYRAKKLDTNDTTFFKNFYDLQKYMYDKIKNVQEQLDNLDNNWKAFKSDTESYIWNTYQKIIDDISQKINNFTNFIQTFLSTSDELKSKHEVRAQVIFDEMEVLKEISTNFIKNLYSTHLNDFMNKKGYRVDSSYKSEVDNIINYWYKKMKQVFKKTSSIGDGFKYKGALTNGQIVIKDKNNANVTEEINSWIGEARFSSNNNGFYDDTNFYFDFNNGFLWENYFSDLNDNDFINLCCSPYKSTEWFYFRNNPDELKSIAEWEQVFMSFKEEYINYKIELKNKDVVAINDISKYFEGLLNEFQSSERTEFNGSYSIPYNGYRIKVRQAYLFIVLKIFVNFIDFFFRINGGYEIDDETGDYKVDNNKKYIQEKNLSISTWGTLNSYNNEKNTYIETFNPYKNNETSEITGYDYVPGDLYTPYSGISGNDKINCDMYQKANGQLTKRAFKALTPSIFYDITAQSEYSGNFILDICWKILNSIDENNNNGNKTIYIINALLKGARKGFIKISSKLPGAIHIFKDFNEFYECYARCRHGISHTVKTISGNETDYYNFSTISDFSYGMMNLRAFVEILCAASENYDWIIKLNKGDTDNQEQQTVEKPQNDGTFANNTNFFYKPNDGTTEVMFTDWGLTEFSTGRPDNQSATTPNNGTSGGNIIFPPKPPGWPDEIPWPGEHPNPDTPINPNIVNNSQDESNGPQEQNNNENEENQIRNINNVDDDGDGVPKNQLRNIGEYKDPRTQQIDPNYTSGTVGSNITQVGINGIGIGASVSGTQLVIYQNNNTGALVLSSSSPGNDYSAVTLATTGFLNPTNQTYSSTNLDLSNIIENIYIQGVEMGNLNVNSLQVRPQTIQPAPLTTQVEKEDIENFFKIIFGEQEITKNNTTSTIPGSFSSPGKNCYFIDNLKQCRRLWSTIGDIELYRNQFFTNINNLPMTLRSNIVTIYKDNYETINKYCIRDRHLFNLDDYDRKMEFRLIDKLSGTEYKNAIDNKGSLTEYEAVQEKIKMDKLDLRKIYWWPQWCWINRNNLQNNNPLDMIKTIYNILFYEQSSKNKFNRLLSNHKNYISLDGTENSLKCAQLIQTETVYNNPNRIKLITYSSKFNPDSKYCYYITTFNREFKSDGNMKLVSNSLSYNFMRDTSKDSDIEIILYMKRVAEKRGITRLLEGECYGWLPLANAGNMYGGFALGNRYFYFDATIGAYKLDTNEDSNYSSRNPHYIFDPFDKQANFINKNLYIDRLGSYGDLLDITVYRDFIGAVYNNGSSSYKNAWKRFKSKVASQIQKYYKGDTTGLFEGENNSDLLDGISKIDGIKIGNTTFNLIKQYWNEYNNYITEKQKIKDKYQTSDNQAYNYENEFNKLLNPKDNIINVDWRELIYKMALDYYTYGKEETYIKDLIEANPQYEQTGGITGYEPFYTDILGFWRQLYFNPALEPVSYRIEDYCSFTLEDYNPQTCWNLDVEKKPEKVNFWFDLSSGSGALKNYRICDIGDRMKATNDSKITSIDYKPAPEIIFYYPDEEIKRTQNDGLGDYSFLQLGGPIQNVASISSKSKTSIQLLQEQLYKYAYCVETVTITTLPFYTIQPNTRVFINSSIEGLTGEYIVTKFTQPLTYNGTMQITAVKAVPYLGLYQNQGG